MATLRLRSAIDFDLGRSRIAVVGIGSQSLFQNSRSQLSVPALSHRIKTLSTSTANSTMSGARMPDYSGMVNCSSRNRNLDDTYAHCTDARSRSEYSAASFIIPQIEPSDDPITTRTDTPQEACRPNSTRCLARVKRGLRGGNGDHEPIAGETRRIPSRCWQTS